MDLGKAFAGPIYATIYIINPSYGYYTLTCEFMNTLRNILMATFAGATLSTAAADVIQWADSQGTLDKGFDNESASFTIDTSTNALTVQLDHNNTSSGMDSASQWVINRWPPSPDFNPANGEFNVVSNANNDVVLGLYGFYGENGFDASTPASEVTVPQIGDSVTYTLSLEFAVPVTTLGFQINNINALSKVTNFNSRDSLTVAGFLGADATASPTYSDQGSGITRTGDQLEGDWDNRIGLNNPSPYDVADQHVTDEGSVNLEFGEAVDRVTLTLTNIAEDNSTPVTQEEIDGGVGIFSPGFDDDGTPDVEERLQTWSFSVGDVTFTTIPEPSSMALLGMSSLLFFRRKRSA